MTPAENITRAYRGTWANGQGLIPTPGHSAKDRGTTVRDTPDGDVVFHSFNGGDWRALKDECRTRGLLPEREVSPQNAAQPNRRAWRQTGSFEYADATGAVLYRTVRKERDGDAKRFQAQRLEGGRWIDGMGEVERVPYRLPELLASDADTPVYFVEGERKADKLAGWGFTATAVAFGSKGWRRDYAQHFAGRVVVIMPDNDEPGQAFAATVKEALEGIAATVAIMELPGLPPKGDIIDWQGDAGELRTLTDKALNPPADTFPIADLAAWASTEPTPKAFVLAGHVPARELTLITGAGGANKSTFGQQLATCVAAGLPMLGLEVQQGGALYITAEDDSDRLHWMQAHICRALRVPMPSLAGKLHLVSLRGRLGNELATFDNDGKIRPSPAFATLKATVAATRPALVVIDNAAHVFAGNENDRGQVTQFVNLLYGLTLDYGVSILLVAHANKAGDSYSGSTAWLNAVRSQIVITRPDGSHDPDERLLTLGKANYARQGEELRFRWHDFALVRDDDLPPAQRVEIAAVALANGDNAAFLACLRQRVKEGEGRLVGPAPGPNYAPAQFEGMTQAKGLKRDRLKVAMERLFAIGAIETHTYRNTSKARDVTVIRETSGTASPNPEPLPRTRPEHSPRTTPNSPPEHPPAHSPPKGGNGAALWAPAPTPDSRMILAPGETGDDVDLGLGE